MAKKTPFDARVLISFKKEAVFEHLFFAMNHVKIMRLPSKGFRG